MYDEVLDKWDLPRPREVVRSAFGMSNKSYFVTSAAGAHVLRVHVAKSLQAIRFEHEVLRRLLDADLPFQVPQPLSTLRGDTVALDIDSARQCALFRRIPGETLDDADTVAVARAGAAFARLDAALAGIERTDLPAPVFAGDLRAMHPAVTDLGQLDELVGRPGREMVERAAERAGPIYASLPTQLIHGDFGYGNVLVSSGRVRGVVDFEYAGRDRKSTRLNFSHGYISYAVFCLKKKSTSTRAACPRRCSASRYTVSHRRPPSTQTPRGSTSTSACAHCLRTRYR